MNRLLLTAALLASFAAPAAADIVDVSNLGSILNQSIALPVNSTPGSGIAFEQYFIFSLPTTETVTASVSDSGVGPLKVKSGVISLDTQVGLIGIVPFGAVLDSTPFTNTIGGQEATVGPDILGAGAYFAEVSGVSGNSPIRLAIDGTITALATPEPSTWAMLAMGFASLGWLATRRRRVSRYV